MEDEIDQELEIEKVLTSLERIATKLSTINPEGRKPSVLASSAIYLASELLAKKTQAKIFTKQEISRICDVPSTTLRAHTKYLSEKINVKV